MKIEACYSDSEHEIGLDGECPECWKGYPVKCKCGGNVHAEFYDESFDDVALSYKCDKCGDNYEELE